MVFSIEQNSIAITALGIVVTFAIFYPLRNTQDVHRANMSQYDAIHKTRSTQLIAMPPERTKPQPSAVYTENFSEVRHKACVSIQTDRWHTKNGQTLVHSL